MYYKIGKVYKNKKIVDFVEIDANGSKPTSVDRILVLRRKECAHKFCQKQRNIPNCQGLIICLGHKNQLCGYSYETGEPLFEEISNVL
jgi:hypothetical protein